MNTLSKLLTRGPDRGPVDLVLAALAIALLGLLVVAGRIGRRPALILAGRVLFQSVARRGPLLRAERREIDETVFRVGSRQEGAHEQYGILIVQVGSKLKRGIRVMSAVKREEDLFHKPN